MEKEFDGWNEIKKKTNREMQRLYTVREIWWTRLGVNVGTEQDGKGRWFARPCIIIRGFGAGACLIVPLTTSTRDHPLRVPIGVVNGRPTRANLSQIRVIDTRRLEQKVGFLDEMTFAELRKNIRLLF